MMFHNFPSLINEFLINPSDKTPKKKTPRKLPSEGKK